MSHKHNWRPDGESFNKTNHENMCEWGDGDSTHPVDKLKCLKNCEWYLVRRYTCHCGAKKVVKLEEENQ